MRISFIKYFTIGLLALLSLIVNAQNQQISFGHFTTDDGISSDRITNIFQDSRGFLWISTQDGINRYDGFYFKKYRHITGDINSLSDYAANHIFEDSKGLFWISTREGLNLFNPLTENFVHFKPMEDDTNSISSEKIVVTTEDKFGNIWVGTRNGLNLFDPDKKIFQKFYHSSADEFSLSSNYVTSILYDSKENLWVGTQNGLNRYNYREKTFERIFNDHKNSGSIVGNLIRDLFEDKDNNLWVATSSGLSKLISDEGSSLNFLNYNSDESDENSISSNNIRVIAQDHKGNLWIATADNGVNVFNQESGKFFGIKYSSSDLNSLSEDRIYALCIDQTDNVWIGTASSGINKFSPTKERFIYFQPKPTLRMEIPTNNISAIFLDNQRRLWLGTYGDGVKVYATDSLMNPIKLLFELKADENNPKALSNNIIRSIVQDKEGYLWLGTYGGGLDKLDPRTGLITNYKYNKNDTTSLGDIYIHNLYLDSEGVLWVGTALGGLNKFEREKDSFKRFSIHPKLNNHPKYLNSYEVTSICEDSKGFLWVGTSVGGLSRMDKIKSNFIHFKHDQQNANSIGSNRISTIYLDSQNRLWVGTFSGGLNLYNEDANSFTHYMESDGLASNIIQSIMEDEEGNLWLSTLNGISRFNPETKQCKNFSISDGLQGKGFYENSIQKDPKNGAIFFGGSNGLNIYIPGSIKEDVNPPDIIITDFKLFNKSFPFYKNVSSLDKESALQEIILAHDQDVITFEFAAMDFTSPQKNQYAYMLEGFDNDWVYSGNRREATYTNLSSGSYVFKVKGTNSDGVWNETGTSINIIIKPPFWKTWWAFLTYFLIAASGFFFVRKYELNRIKLRNNLKLKEFESQKLQEVDQLKSRFFANISHEFRTPLTIILGSLEKLKVKMENTSDVKEFDVMKRNASRLLQLINQLLELSRIEAGNVKLQAAENDIVKFLRRIIASFASLTYQKNVKLTFNGLGVEESKTSDEILLYFDRKKLETVFYNLLSNAVKFTPGGENIDIKISQENKSVKIVFENSGIEIPSNEIDMIFDRFYQVDDSGTRNFEGTGIGLSLVKEYIELHKGKIEVQSANSKTTFTVYLPLGKSHLNIDQIVEIASEKSLIESNTIEKESLIPAEISENIIVDSDKTIVLVVEDNPDLREMIKENLQVTYSILEAENGAKGFKLAEENIPDLIISDIMMPEMDGYELTKRLKTNEKTNHIPVILLTAKAATEDKLEGLETGADDYLIKPFNEKELTIRVKNLIKSHQQMREKYLAQSLVKPGSVVVPSSQKIFIERLTSIVESNISNESFSVEVLCREIGMSRTQLHRKIKSVTNQSTTEFIRNYRLQLAAELLMQDSGNIAEISNKVGFNSQAYFTKLFQELYGLTPLEYKKQHS